MTDLSEIEHCRMPTLLMCGAHRPLARLFELPVGIYAGSAKIVCPDEPRLLGMLDAFRRMFTRAGVATVELNTLAQPLKTRPRGTVWAEMTCFDIEGAVLERTNLRYFLQTSEGRRRIRMIEFMKAPAMLDLDWLAEIVGRVPASGEPDASPARQIRYVLPGDAT